MKPFKSVNFNVFKICNMSCRFCHSNFTAQPAKILPRLKGIALIRLLAENGIEKITFTGGEPTISPNLQAYILAAKGMGMTTNVITNGWGLNTKFFDDAGIYLDWITLSLDSMNPLINKASGRAIMGHTPIEPQEYLDTIDRIVGHGYKLRINTLVTTLNHGENLTDIIRYAKPRRWKVMKMLLVKGENENAKELVPSDIQFRAYMDRHKRLKPIALFNNDMIGSYLMIDHLGRFFSNINNKHVFSKPILEVGFNTAFEEMKYDNLAFMNRQGIYNWRD